MKARKRRMTNQGISLSLENFRKLPATRQRYVLFENTEKLKTMMYRYKLHQKIQYMGLAAAWVVIGIIFKFMIGSI